MKWWSFGQETKAAPDGTLHRIPDEEAYHWTEVMPGDIVQSNGTRAWREHEFRERLTPSRARPLTLSRAPVLVLSRIPGIPGELDESSGYVTFTVLSRHGILVITQVPKVAPECE